MMARTVYDAYRAALVTVAAGIAVWTFTGALNDPQGGPVAPQMGHTVTGYDSSPSTFNDDGRLHTSQVSR